jgi:SulP family sulfate permease
VCSSASEQTSTQFSLTGRVNLDFGMVSGADSSALVSFAKLRNFCGQRGTTLVYCSLSHAHRRALERAGFFGGKSQHQVVADLDLALAWCEDRLLAKAGIETKTDLGDFELWLQHQLGPSVRSKDFASYFERRDIDSSQILYREGEPADTIDLVSAGHLAVDIARHDGKGLRVRRIMTHTVVGEMGFFRRSARSATVLQMGPSHCLR